MNTVIKFQDLQIEESLKTIKKLEEEKTQKVFEFKLHTVFQY